MARSRTAALLVSLVVAVGVLASPGQAVDTTVPTPSLTSPPDVRER